MDLSVGTIEFLSLVAAIVAMLARRLGMPYSVGVVVAGLAPSLFHTSPQIRFSILIRQWSRIWNVIFATAKTARCFLTRHGSPRRESPRYSYTCPRGPMPIAFAWTNDKAIGRAAKRAELPLECSSTR